MAAITHISFAKDHRQILPRHPSKAYGLRGLGDIKKIAVHHSLTSSGSAKAFANYHINTNKWPGIGYHFVIEKDGSIIWCHDLEVRSYHVGNSNRIALGICLVGDFRTQTLEEVQLQPLIKLLRFLLQELRLTPDDVKGHSEFPDYAWKPCPCIDMQQLRNGLIANSNANSSTIDDRNMQNRSPSIPEVNFLQVLRGGNLFMNAERAGIFQAPGLRVLNIARPPVHRESLPVPHFRIKGVPEKTSSITLQLVKSLHQLGHRVFEADHKPYNLNIVGVRSNNMVPNSFDDALHVFWKFENTWHHQTFKVTTDPGLSPLLQPENSKGTAILKAGQYRGAYSIGRHKGYEALVQTGPVTVVRDNNRDRLLDFTSGPEFTGFFKINIHRANPKIESVQVDGWSAGCQVFANPIEFKEFMRICRLAASEWGEKFTYTLINEDDLLSI